MTHGIDLLVVIGMIAFVFGERAAKVCVAIILLVPALFFVYVAYRTLSGHP